MTEPHLSWYRLHEFARDLGKYKISHKTVTNKTHQSEQIVIEYNHRLKDKS